MATLYKHKDYLQNIQNLELLDMLEPAPSKETGDDDFDIPDSSTLLGLLQGFYAIHDNNIQNQHDAEISQEENEFSALYNVSNTSLASFAKYVNDVRNMFSSDALTSR